MSTPVTDLRDATIAPVRACAVDTPSVGKTLRVISLQGERGRRDAFRANNPTLAFEFVDAIDGRALSDDDIARSGLFAPALPYTRGAIGIAMTTHRLWTDIAAGSELVTIVEDDAIFRPDFDETAMQFLAAHAGRYDFVAWGPPLRAFTSGVAMLQPDVR